MNVAPVNNDYLANCARATDFALCDMVAGGIEEKFGYPVMPTMGASVHERVAFLVWSGQGFAEKEGLARQLELPFDRPGWADAYELIGLPHVAEGLRVLIARLPDPYAQCLDVGDRLQDVSSTLKETEKRLWDDSNEVCRHLAEYIRSQLERFAGYTTDAGRPCATNVGYLLSVHTWIESFAGKHHGDIPSFADLQRFTTHDGLKNAATDEYVVLLKGKLSDQHPSEPLAYLRRPIFEERFCVTVGGEVRPYRPGE
jgi:hypothetical protein